MSNFGKYLFNLLRTKAGIDGAIESLIDLLQSKPYSFSDEKALRDYLKDCKNAEDVQFALISISMPGCSMRMVANLIFDEILSKPATTSVKQPNQTAQEPNLTQSSSFNQQETRAQQLFKQKLTESFKLLGVEDIHISSFIESLKKDGVDTFETCIGQFGDCTDESGRLSPQAICDKLSASDPIEGLPHDWAAGCLCIYLMQQIAATSPSSPSSMPNQRSGGRNPSVDTETSEEKWFREALLSLTDEKVDIDSVNCLIDKLSDKNPQRLNGNFNTWRKFFDAFRYTLGDSKTLMNTLIKEGLIPQGESQKYLLIVDYLGAELAKRIQFRNDVCRLVSVYHNNEGSKIDAYIDLMAEKGIDTWDEFYSIFYSFKNDEVIKLKDNEAIKKKFDSRGLLHSKAFPAASNHPATILLQEMKAQQIGFHKAVRDALSKDARIDPAIIGLFIGSLNQLGLDCWNRFIAEFGGSSNGTDLFYKLSACQIKEVNGYYGEFIAPHLFDLIKLKRPVAAKAPAAPSSGVPSHSQPEKPSQPVSSLRVVQSTVVPAAAPAPKATQSPVSSSSLTPAVPAASFFGTSGTKTSSSVDKKAPPRHFGKELVDVLLADKLPKFERDQAVSIFSRLVNVTLATWYALEEFYFTDCSGCLESFHLRLIDNGVLKDEGSHPMAVELSQKVAQVLALELERRRAETNASVIPASSSASLATSSLFASNSVSDLKQSLDEAVKATPNVQSAVEQLWSNLRGKQITTIDDLLSRLQGCEKVIDVRERLTDLELLANIDAPFRQRLSNIICTVIKGKLNPGQAFNNQ